MVGRARRCRPSGPPPCRVRRAGSGRGRAFPSAGRSRGRCRSRGASHPARASVPRGPRASGGRDADSLSQLYLYRLLGASPALARPAEHRGDRADPGDTHNIRDFPAIVREWAAAQRPHAGVILVYGIDHRDFDVMVRGIERCLDLHPAQNSWQNLALIVDRGFARTAARRIALPMAASRGETDGH